MTKTGIISLVVIVVLLAGGIWWWMAAHQSMPTATNTGSPASTPSVTSTTSTAPLNNSDAWIANEMTQANAQMNNFNSDNTSISSGMNDQPVAQGQ